MQLKTSGFFTSWSIFVTPCVVCDEMSLGLSVQSTLSHKPNAHVIQHDLQWIKASIDENETWGGRNIKFLLSPLKGNSFFQVQ